MEDLVLTVFFVSSRTTSHAHKGRGAEELRFRVQVPGFRVHAGFRILGLVCGAWEDRISA